MLMRIMCIMSSNQPTQPNEQTRHLLRPLFGFNTGVCVNRPTKMCAVPTQRLDDFLVLAESVRRQVEQQNLGSSAPLYVNGTTVHHQRITRSQ